MAWETFRHRLPASPRSRTMAVALAPLVLVAYAARAEVTSVRVASGLAMPVFVTAPVGDTGRLFILEQHTGQIRILDLASETLEPTPFLTVTDISNGDEQGLLGLAFHPGYADNGLFYVNVTNGSGDTEIRRYQVSDDPDIADAGSESLVLGYDQPQENHNGGWLGFGFDGYLYIASGDGGGTNDDDTGHTAGTGNAQDITANLLGKILRIDIAVDDFPEDDSRNYAIPPSNPFVGKTGDDEIWAFGLRNPWRASFDMPSGRLYIGDVGQGAREEINVQPGESAGGENYGWRLREGTIQTPGAVGGPKPAGAIDPIYDYTRGDGASQGFVVTGGYVYRGPIAELQGRYFFADYLSERIWSLVYDGSAPSGFNGTNFTELTDRTAELAPSNATIDLISSFGEDALGNLYIVDHGGEVFRIEEVGGPTTTTMPGFPECGDAVADGSIAASDALHVLRTSVGTAWCVLCICDVNDNGEMTVADALAVLRVAVGHSVVLDCPAC
jgi:glucose/arabinose dehydrogenase